LISVIDLVLSLLASILSTATKNGAANEIITGIQSAIDALVKVQGTPVTYSQLENLRVKPEW
jgi:hypothetical protein